MRKPWLALLLVMSLLLAACGSTTSAPSATDTTATRTPKPTFTPATGQAEQPTAAPATLQATSAGAPTAKSETATATLIPTVTPTPAATATTAPPPAKGLRMSSPEYGMQIFPWWRPEVGSRDLQAIQAAGFSWAKVNFGWRDIEGANKGAFDWSRTDQIVQMANADDVDLVIRVDHQPAWAGGGFPTNGPPDNYQHLADFFTALATRYKGRIRAYEVWNEPNLAREWGGQTPDPAGYARLLKACYSAIKAADPNAMVISAGLSPTGSWTAGPEGARPDDWYLETLYIAMGGSSNGYFDVLGAHGAGFASPPERDPAEVAANPALGGHRSMCFRRVEDLRAIMVKYGDTNKQVALLEFGWTSDPRPDSPYSWHAVSEQTKADYFVRAYQYAKANWSPWIGLMSLIYISDPDWTQQHEQYWWAITDPGWPELKPRAAYTALKNMPK
ncbi:MAG: cellulase family glycosylhydrolase [Anaerolineae bacterium]|jgi:hypothetical protein